MLKIVLLCLAAGLLLLYAIAIVCFVVCFRTPENDDETLEDFGGIGVYEEDS